MSVKMELESIALFLSKYRWMFNFKVTEILSDSCLDSIPLPWRSYLEALTLDQFNYHFMPQSRYESASGVPSSSLASTSQPDCQCKVDPQLAAPPPPFVQLFLSELRAVGFQWTKRPLSHERLDPNQRRGISLKKEHEIINLTELLLDTCQSDGGRELMVMDVGSGVGYLDENLSRRGLRVVAVEGNAGYHGKAVERHERSSQDILTVNLTIDDSTTCRDKLDRIVRSPTALVGLHCCGDLTPALLRLFHQIDNIRLAAIVSCCYHKMTSASSFPLSQQLKNVFTSLEGKMDFVNEYMLRLGAQETLVRWLDMNEEDHARHMNNVGFRAVLETWMTQKNLILQKKKRKTVKQDKVQDFQDFVQTLDQSYIIPDTAQGYREELMSLYHVMLPLFHLTELLTGLQFLLQSVIENWILLDRKVFLEENMAGVCCQVVEIFDESLSPRNKVVVARKP